MTDAPRIAMLGTGTMGVGMTHSLLRAGLPVTVWNRHVERARPLAHDGAEVAERVEDAVRDADVVITMLFDVDAVAEVIAAAAPAMRPDAVWVQSSTVGRAGIAALAGVANQHGLTMVDAPMVGTKQPAEEGKLVILASGPSSVSDRVQPAFDAMGSKTVWLGEEPGSASAMKLVANSWVASINAAAAQGVAMAQAFGLDPAQFLSTVSGGAADSPYLQAKGSAMIERRFDPQFRLDGVLKDVRLMRDAATEAAMPTILLDALITAYEGASRSGHGREDMAAVVTTFEPARD